MPVLLGLPWLASAIAAIFGAVVSWLATYITKRLAILVAALLLLATLTVAFIAAMEGLIAGLSLTVPYASVVALFLPDEFTTLLGLYISARLLWWAYWWNVKIVQLKLF